METIQYLDFGGGYTNLQGDNIVWTPPTPQTHTSTSKTGDIKIRSADYINVSMVVYYSSAKCYHWGKLDRVYSVLFLTCESIIISIKTSVTKNKLVLAPLQKIDYRLCGH